MIFVKQKNNEVNTVYYKNKKRKNMQKININKCGKNYILIFLMF